MAHRMLAALLVAFFVAGCALVPGARTPEPTSSLGPSPSTQPSPTDASPSPLVSPSPSPSPSPSTAPTPSGSLPAGFYLRGWYTQAIPPQYTFSWLPPVTIADGTYINGNVAVPAIYPGPLMIVPVARSISAKGQAAIVDEAKALGLLSGDGDFTGVGPKPGAKLVNLEMVVDGKRYELVGEENPYCDPAACTPQPGTAGAFAKFWADLLALDSWQASELSQSSQYEPERIALQLHEVAEPPTMSPSPTLVEWPLEVPLKDALCLTLAGDDLATMLPILESATQLTAFYQGTTVSTPFARVLVPGEPSPCDA